MSKKTFKNDFDDYLMGVHSSEDNKQEPAAQEYKTVKFTFHMPKELADKLGAVSYWERISKKEFINKSLEESFSKYEKEKGKIQPIPK